AHPARGRTGPEVPGETGTAPIAAGICPLRPTGWVHEQQGDDRDDVRRDDVRRDDRGPAVVTRLGLRALGRATLARQFLLERAAVPVVDAVAHLCGLQAQEPQAPFVGLWSRL